MDNNDENLGKTPKKLGKVGQKLGKKAKNGENSRKIILTEMGLRNG